MLDVDASRGDFRSGGSNSDRVVDIRDARTALDCLFDGGPQSSCLDTAGANDNGAVDLSDVVAILNWVLDGSGIPLLSGPLGCGFDATKDYRGSVSIYAFREVEETPIRRYLPACERMRS